LLSDEVFYELLQVSEYSTESEINVKILSGGEQNVSFGVKGKVPVLRKAHGDSGYIELHFHDLGTSWRGVVSFIPRPLHPWGKRPRYPLDRR
jgi:hypothetical protein